MPSVDTIFEAVHATMEQLNGGYAVVLMIKGVGAVAFRDPYGIRYSTFPPLFLLIVLCALEPNATTMETFWSLLPPPRVALSSASTSTASVTLAPAKSSSSTPI